MKNYQIKGMMPNTNQFFSFIKENSNNNSFNHQTMAYKGYRAKAKFKGVKDKV